MKKILAITFLVMITMTGCIKYPSNDSSSSSSTINIEDLFDSSTTSSNNKESSKNTNSDENNSTSFTSSKDKVDDILPGSGFGPLHKTS